MRFLHTSDWHLGMTYRGGISYADDQRYAIDGICAAAEDEGVDGILIAGDIFDKSVSSQEALMMCDGIITHICSDLKIPVYMIAGNHDGAQRLAQYNRLLRGSGLYIAGSLTKDVCAMQGMPIFIFCRGYQQTRLKPCIPKGRKRSVRWRAHTGLFSMNTESILRPGVLISFWHMRSSWKPRPV